jgi:hypothetical protein
MGLNCHSNLISYVGTQMELCRLSATKCLGLQKMWIMRDDSTDCERVIHDVPEIHQPLLPTARIRTTFEADPIKPKSGAASSSMTVVRLSPRSLRNIQSSHVEKTFEFFVGDESHHCHWFVAEYVSPVICELRHSDIHSPSASQVRMIILTVVFIQIFNRFSPSPRQETAISTTSQLPQRYPLRRAPLPWVSRRLRHTKP